MASHFDTSFLIRPLEPLFFGRPQSFTAGDAHHSHSEFPPSPMTFQGLIRTRLLSAARPPLNLDDWSPAARKERESLIGEPDALPEGWQIEGPLPATLARAKGNPPGEPTLAPWLPAPLFLLKPGPSQHRKRTEPVRAQVFASAPEGPDQLKAALNDLDSDWLLTGDPRNSSNRPVAGWLGPKNLVLALSGEDLKDWDPSQHAEQLPPFVKFEPQAGIALDDPRKRPGAARQGMLYQQVCLRFEESAGLWGRLKGPVDSRIPSDALTQAAGTAGRKRRLVAFSGSPPLSQDWKALLQGRYLEKADDQGYFWLVLVSPLQRDGQRHPAVPPLPNGVNLKFRSALLGSSLTYGGFSMATGKSRPNLPFHPPGSAWLFQLSGGDQESRRSALKLLHNGHLLGDRHLARFGFGHTLVGVGPRRNTP
ncbi:MAG TPA: type III-B CRISPR module-associated Cmr3 family protein [Acidobacteriota bacterium]|nr:type III-B CRISPR module-associated Cmr3 family protein [Acidobacteriota bacterium]